LGYCSTERQLFRSGLLFHERATSKEKARLLAGLSLRKSEKFLPVILDDQVIDDAVGLVDVMDGAIAQSADAGIIFFAGNVVVRLVEELEGAVKAASAVHAGVDRRMVFQVLAVINRGMLDFADGLIDFFDGVLFFAVHMFGRRELAQVSAGVTQVGEGMQVGRMPSGFVSESQSGADGDKKHEYGAMSYSFHSLLVLFLVVVEWPFGGSVLRR
jgi:hypothetical protein